MYGLGLDGYDADSHQEAAVAFGIQVDSQEQRIAQHRHRKGQLILALKGAITCEVENARWMVPPHLRCGCPVLCPTVTALRKMPNSIFYLLSRGRW